MGSDSSMESKKGQCRAKSCAQQNVGQTERFLSTAGGLLLGLLGAQKRSVPLAALSAGLMYRGLSGNCKLYQAIGLNTMGRVKLKPLNEQVIVITGASSGIGLATAEAAARAGAKVVLAARSEDILQEVASRINNAGGDAIAVYADVGDRENVEKISKTALEKYGRIDTWVNNSGVSIFGKLEEVTESDSRRLFDTNFWGVVNGSIVALKQLRKTGGALINVGSEVSEEVVPLQGMYSATKHAVKGFTDALRIEVEQVDKAPVSITLIQPTAVNTPFPRNAKNYMDVEPQLPSPQIDPEQVASAILDAAINPRRDVKVGAFATINTAVAKFLPSLGDKMSAKQFDAQRSNRPPARDRDGSLYGPGESGMMHNPSAS